MSTIIKDTLHPENESGTDIYPKTSKDQIVGYGSDLEDKPYALVEESCKKPTLLGTPQYVLGVSSGESNQPIAINIGVNANQMPKRNAGGHLEDIANPTSDNDLTRKKYVDDKIAEVSSPVVIITAPDTATSGTITSADLTLIQGNKDTKIYFANEYYILADNQHTSGYITFTHVGDESGKTYVKTFTITISTLGWVKITTEVGGGGSRIYKHTIIFRISGSAYQLIIFTNSLTQIVQDTSYWYDDVTKKISQAISFYLYIATTKETTPVSYNNAVLTDVSGETYSLSLGTFMNEVVALQ